MAAKSSVVKGACPHDCPDQCAWNVTVEGGRALAVTGDPTHPFTAGALCSKLKHFVDRVYSPERILHPLRRTGEKGLANFERVSWDVALDDIAARMAATIEQYSGASVMPYSFAGTIGIAQRYAGNLLFRRIGATEVITDYCGKVAHAGIAQTNGALTAVLPEDVINSRFIVLWGTNTVVTNLHMWSGVIRKAQEQGAKIVVIDPVRTRTAERADWHVQIKPGTDAALALGMMHVIIRDGLQDTDYVERYTVGFAELSERVADYPPARVAAITGLGVADIETLAREFAGTKPATIRMLVGPERQGNGAEMFRAIACLPSLTGAWRERGGGLCHFTADLFRESLNYNATVRADELPDPPRSVHIAQLGRALTGGLDPAVHCLFVYNANPVVAAPNQNLVRQGLARDDLFTVVHEQFMTDTARYADYVLPATTQIEHLDIMASWGSPFLELNLPAIAPVGEAMSNTALYRQLAARLGLDDAFLHASDETRIREILDSDHPFLEGITYERLEREGWVRLNLPDDWRPLAEGAFRTPSGKCEFYSDTLASAGIDPLPTYTPPPQPPAASPLTLIAAKTAHHTLNTQYANLQRPGRRLEPCVSMNPVDADARGITTGDRVRVFNERGEVELNAAVGVATGAGLVSIPFGWWPDALYNGSSANALTADDLTNIGMGSNAFDTFVEIAKVAAS